MQEVLAALDGLCASPEVDPECIAVLGCSRGGLLAFDTATERPSELRVRVLMAPTSGRGRLERALGEMVLIQASSLLLVADNDLVQDDHVALVAQVAGALEAADKEVQKILYPPFTTPGNQDGQMRFDEVRESCWGDALSFLAMHLTD